MEALNREQAIPELIDPTGRKWVIKGDRGTALVQARPEQDREDAVIPKEFHGRWTSPSVLREKIEIWLNRQWDKSDQAKIKATRKEYAEKVEKKTAEESLEELPDEVKDALGDILEVKTDGSEDAKAEAATAGNGRDTKEDHNEELAGRSTDTRSEKEEKEKAFEEMNYAELLEAAKARGIKAKKKVEILEALRGTTD